jgi:hypothetical protein
MKCGNIFSTMIIEKEKILWKPRNAGIACEGSAYIGIYAHGVNVRLFCGKKFILPFPPVPYPISAAAIL